MPRSPRPRRHTARADLAPGSTSCTAARAPRRPAWRASGDWTRRLDPGFVRAGARGGYALRRAAVGDGRLVGVGSSRGGAIERREALGLGLSLLLGAGAVLGWALWTGGASRAPAWRARAGRAPRGRRRLQRAGRRARPRRGGPPGHGCRPHGRAPRRARAGARRVRGQGLARPAHAAHDHQGLRRTRSSAARPTRDAAAPRRHRARERPARRARRRPADAVAGRRRRAAHPARAGSAWPSCCEEVAERVDALACRARASVVETRARGGAWLVGDRRRLAQVLTNLATERDAPHAARRAHRAAAEVARRRLRGARRDSTTASASTRPPCRALLRALRVRRPVRGRGPRPGDRQRARAGARRQPRPVTPRRRAARTRAPASPRSPPRWSSHERCLRAGLRRRAARRCGAAAAGRRAAARAGRGRRRRRRCRARASWWSPSRWRRREPRPARLRLVRLARGAGRRPAPSPASRTSPSGWPPSRCRWGCRSCRRCCGRPGPDLGLRQGERAVGVRVDEVGGLAGLLRAGARVDVLVSGPDEDGPVEQLAERRGGARPPAAGARTVRAGRWRCACPRRRRSRSRAAEAAGRRIRCWRGRRA